MINRLGGKRKQVCGHRCPVGKRAKKWGGAKAPPLQERQIWLVGSGHLAATALQKQSEGGGTEAEGGRFRDDTQAIDADVAEVGPGQG